MAVLYPDGNSFPHSTFHGVPFHSFPSSFLPFRRSSRLLQPSTWLCSLLLSTDTAQTAYSILSRRSPLFPPPSAFSSIVHVEMWGIPVAILTTTGVFSCLVDLQPGAVDNIYDLRLGRDSFNFCTTAIPNAKILLSDDMCLMFSSSPLLAVRSRRTSEFLLS